MLNHVWDDPHFPMIDKISQSNRMRDRVGFVPRVCQWINCTHLAAVAQHRHYSCNDCDVQSQRPNTCRVRIGKRSADLSAR